MPQQCKHTCRYCGNEFTSGRRRQKYCPGNLRSCRINALGMYAENMASEDQYEKLDGNLRGVLNKLRTSKGERKDLRLRELIELWNRQEGRCAITGIAMTCRAERGSFFPYNVSIDRIIPKWEGGTYALNNIQLVCKVVNDIKKHYRMSDINDGIRAFAEKVIEGQKQAYARFTTMQWAPAYTTSLYAGLVVSLGADVHNAAEALIVTKRNHASPEPDQPLHLQSTRLFPAAVIGLDKASELRQ